MLYPFAFFFGFFAQPTPAPAHSTTRRCFVAQRESKAVKPAYFIYF
jgi:hypothetical protein